MTDTASQKPEALVREGNRALASDQPAEALAYFGQALNLDSRNSDTWTQCGVALQQLGHYQAAMTANNNAQALLNNPQAQLQPLSVTLQAPEGMALPQPITAPAISQGSVPSATVAPMVEPDVDRRMGLDNADFWLRRGNQLANAGGYELAIASFDRALALKPNNYDLLNQKGTVLYQMGKHDLALEIFAQAIDVNPEGYQAWHNRASIYADQGQYEAALPDYDKALAVTQNQLWPAWEDRAMCLYFVHGYQAALKGLDEGLTKVVSHHPEYGRACGSFWQRKGDFQYREGKTLVAPLPVWQDARVSYVNALEHLPIEQFPEQHLLILQSLLTVCCHLGDWQALQHMLPEGLDYLSQMLNTLALAAEDQTRLKLQYLGLQQLRVDQEAQTNVAAAMLLADAVLYEGLAQYTDLPPAEITQYQQLQPHLSAQTRLLTWHVSPAAVSCFILASNQAPLLMHPKGQDVAEPQTAAMHMALNRYKLEDWLQQWQARLTDDEASANARHYPSPSLQAALTELADLLDIPHLQTHHLAGITRILIIASPALQSVPFHALFPDQEVTYLPTLQLGIKVSRPHEFSQRQLLALSPDVPTSATAQAMDTALQAVKLQVDRITQAYAKPSYLGGQQATQARVIAALKLAGGRCHMTAPAIHDVEQPLYSHFQLAPDHCLTMAELLQLDLHRLSVMVLPHYAEPQSPTSRSLPTIQLASSLLIAGVSHVIYPLWPVPPLPLTLMMIQLHHKLIEYRSPLRALQETQVWLRHLTYEDLRDWCAQQDAQEHNVDLRFASLNPPVALETDPDKGEFNDCPYADPMYWASFKVMGRLA